MSSTVVLKAVGLNKSPNQLDLPPGSMTEASNVIIKRDNVVESRRGFKLFGNSFGTSTDIAKQLMVYKNRIIRHYTNILEYDNGLTDTDGVEQFSAFSGTYSETDIGRRIRSIESNSNFYFTTSTGIKKISADTTDDFTTASGFITQAGGVKALDVTPSLNITLGSSSGFLPQDSAVAYRILWGIKDLNNNLILGTPSQRAEIYNPLLNLLIPDLLNVLDSLDNISASLISDANYVNTLKLPITASASQVRTNLISLTSKLDTDIKYADEASPGSYPLNTSAVSVSSNVATITFSSGDPTTVLSAGSLIEISGFTDSASGSLDGTYTISSLTSSTIVFSKTAPNGAGTVSGSAYIRSNTFRSISQPGAPNLPATDADLVAIQTYLDSIIIDLQALPTGVISSPLSIIWIQTLDVTSTVNVNLAITIPANITAANFYQVYRSPISSATGVSVLSTDVVPSDELQQVYEAFPTAAEISAGQIIFTDDVPDGFLGANLYTNESTGEGILQSNDIPPFARDINKFKNVTFYANTRTKHRLNLNLLGVVNMLSDYNSGTTPKLVVTNGTTTNTYSFIAGVSEVTRVTCAAASTLVSAAAPASYFLINAGNNGTQYYVWYKIGSSTDPALSGKTGIQVILSGSESNSQVATRTGNEIAKFVLDFTTSVTTNVLTVTNVINGICTDASAGTSGFTILVLTQGAGENVSQKKILLSSSVSPSIAVDETARSMVRVLNQNSSETIYAYYLSGASDVPGKMFLESRNLDEIPFYLLANNSTTGQSFNPDLSPEIIISNISVANPTHVTTSSAHGLINQNQVIIVGSNSTPSIDGLYAITYIDSTHFTIPVNVTVLGSTGALIAATSAQVSENDAEPNRIFYSKFLQPEAVPILNFENVGARDKQILRIFPLRDSLFVFKEDGLFRISGEVAPFSVALFDSSCILLAPDSLDVCNNLLYCWTTQGVVSVSEAGVSIVSRPIDVDLLKLASSDYTNFQTATWGIGYESDNSYTVSTITKTDDTEAQIGYRYSTLTNTWTTVDKSVNCGVINPLDDKMYLGPTDVNFIEQERKSFNRTDYADRESTVTLTNNELNGENMNLASVADIAIGDVFVQNQYVTTYTYNQILNKLDIDMFLSPHNYSSTLVMSPGDNIRTKLDALISKIAADPGRTGQSGASPSSDYTKYLTISGTKTITAITAANPTVITCASHGLQSNRIITISGSNSTPSIDGTYIVTVTGVNTFTIPVSIQIPGTTATFVIANEDFRDVKTSYNGMVAALNNDIGVGFNNYSAVDFITALEAIVTNVNNVSRIVTLNASLNFIQGPITVFTSIPTRVTWGPQTFGDPLSLKHIREATLMFENKAFTEATLSFATDLLPKFVPIDFTGDGNGIFGFINGFGSNYFGGTSHSVPFRTYIPRYCQRNRYLVPRFEHSTAREKWSLYGLTLTGEVGLSTRAYR